jgi:hypothetical protein
MDEIEQQRAELGREFGNPEQVKISDRANGINPEYFADLQALMDRYSDMPPEPAYVLNLNPYPLRIASPALANITIPACPFDEDFVAFKFTGVRYEMKLTGDGKYTPVPFEPFLDARAYLRTQLAQERGGVVIYRGDKDPDTDPVIQKELVIARAQMLHFCKEKVREANGEWNTINRSGHRNIGDIHRTAALYLLHIGELDRRPEWLNASLAESNLGDKCPSCKARPERGAAMCTGCGFILDPRAAWELGIIAEPEHVCFRRLSREVLEDMKISHYVSETNEERDQRLAEEFEESKRDLTPQEKAARTRAENKAKAEAEAAAAQQ